MTTFANGCFYGCTNIKLMVLPTTLTAMNGANNNGCFYNCTNMYTVIMNRTASAVNPNQYAFQNAGGSNARIYVPADALATYQANAYYASSNTNHYPYKRGYRLRALNANNKIAVTLSLTYASNTITIKEVYGGTVTVSSTHTATVFTRGEDTSTSGVLSFTDEMFNFNQAITVTVGTHTANETVTVQYTPNTEYAPYVEAATGTVIIT